MSLKDKIADTASKLLFILALPFIVILLALGVIAEKEMEE